MLGLESHKGIRTPLHRTGGKPDVPLAIPSVIRHRSSAFDLGNTRTVNTRWHENIGWAVWPVLLFGALNLAWELLQLPLYTIWSTGTVAEIAYAVIHCTAGDVLIGVAASVTAAFLLKLRGFPVRLDSYSFLGTFLLVGLSYTLFSEWLNVQVRRSWAYTDMMPILPPLGTGLTPLLQWLIIPLLTWLIVVRTRANSEGQ
jgi:hypothetical protein